MKKALIFALCAILALGALGCGAKTSADPAAPSDAAGQPAESAGQPAPNGQMDDRTIGKVVAIDGNSITIQLAEMAQGDGVPEGDEASGDDAGTRPPRSPQAGEGAGEKPTGTPPAGGQPSDGGQDGADGRGGPGGMGGGRMSFTGETVTIAVTDSTAITVEEQGESKQGTIADIAVDSVVEITYGEDDAVTAIAVRSSMGARGGADQNAPDGTAQPAS